MAYKIRMGSYRFSPINNSSDVFRALEYIHTEGHRICRKILGVYLPIAGNIGIFCHDDEEYARLTDIRKTLTDEQMNWNHKYYKLLTPLTFPVLNDIPKTTYTLLYVRKPEANEIRVGDVDFYLPPKQYKKLKESVLSGTIHGASMLERQDLDLVRLNDPSSDVSVFVGSYDLSRIVKPQ